LYNLIESLDNSLVARSLQLIVKRSFAAMNSIENVRAIAQADPEVLKVLSHQSPTCQYFATKVILITGASGFCGKVLLEKIVRTMFQVQKVYLLLRPTSRTTVKQKLTNLIESTAFSFNKYETDQLSKIVAVQGDLSRADLGLSEQDRRTLLQEVHIVYHVAASVKFDASFR
jgi:fatty acyl-CoA reductase